MNWHGESLQGSQNDGENEKHRVAFCPQGGHRPMGRLEVAVRQGEEKQQQNAQQSRKTNASP